MPVQMQKRLHGFRPMRRQSVPEEREEATNGTHEMFERAYGVVRPYRSLFDREVRPWLLSPRSHRNDAGYREGFP